MRLNKVTIEGFRSVRNDVLLNVDPRTTVLLGANDHGKSNILAAFESLNEDFEFKESDLNFDCTKRAAELPRVEFEFVLSKEERVEITQAANAEMIREQFGTFSLALEEQEDGVRTARNDFLRGLPDDEEDRTEEHRSRLKFLDETGARCAALRALARADEMTALSNAEGGAPPNFEEFAVIAEAELHVSEGKLAAAEKLKEERTEELESANSEHGDGSEPSKLATRKLKQASVEFDKAQSARNRARAAARQMRARAEAVSDREAGKLEYAEDLEPPTPRLAEVKRAAARVTFERAGMDGHLTLTSDLGVPLGDVFSVLRGQMPRVETISSPPQIPDSATAEEILEPSHEAMRGIFLYAGLERSEWRDLFEQDDETEMRLERANIRLNSTLRESWSQGEGLEFRLTHRDGEIQLLIKDPAVSRRFVRASERSSGFTHFFALKTMLFARQSESGASSFLWLFDEPGIYLHPAGQHDLLQTFEALSATNQLVYSTHSVFLINKNFQQRHRLVVKGGDGTTLDHKPFTSRWRSAFDALGVGLPGSILFANHVLLVEGASDPDYFLRDVQKLVELGALNFDLNPLSVIATGSAPETAALVRLLRESAQPPKILVLFDGDHGGSEREAKVKRLLGELAGRVEYRSLPDKSSIEDNLVFPGLYADAVGAHLSTITGDSAAGEAIAIALRQDLESPGLSDRADDACKPHLEGQKPSKLGIAREYMRLVDSADPDASAKGFAKDAKQLARMVFNALDMSSLGEVDDEIFDAE